MPGELTSPRFARAFAQGCRGIVSCDPSTLKPGPFAAFCTPPLWPLLRQAKAEGRDCFYGDHAYFDVARGRQFRITKNAYQHDGRGTVTSQRFDAFGLTVKPWRRAGSHIVVCPNSAPHFACHGVYRGDWLETVTSRLQQSTDREIRVRTKHESPPLADDLRGAWAVVVYSSASAIESLMAGVPVFVLAPFAAAYRMGSPDLTQIESPVYPNDREPFLWALADNQWTLSEIESGLAWRALQATGVSRAA